MFLPLRASSLLVLFLFVLLAPPHATAQWTNSSLSEARIYLSATSVGVGLALFAGGWNGSASAVVDIYNASSNTWALGTLSQARYLMGATSVLGDLALFAGGESSSADSAVVDIYNASSNTWTTSVLAQARYALAATTVRSLALFAGGLHTSVDSAVVDIYNASSNTWTTTTLSQARYDLEATSVGDLALFAGGNNSVSGYSAVVDIYNASSNTWTTAALSRARCCLAATSVGDLALFAGGYNGSQVGYSIVDIYNASSNTWTTATLSQARWLLAGTTVGGMALFAGGANSSTLFDMVDIYNASSANSWNTTELSQARYHLKATSVGDLAFFAGGLTSTYSSVVDIFNQSVWSSSPSPLASPSPSSTPPATLPSSQATPTPSPSTSPSVSVTPSAAPIASVPVAAEFNLTVPAVAVISQSGGDTGTTAQQIDLGLMSLEEIADNSSVLQAVDLQTVGWTVEQKNGTSGDNTTEYSFTSHLATATDGANNATLLYYFTTFASDKLITTESNYSFTVTPALLKFSLNISSWVWNSESSKLRLTLKISPSFVSFTRWDDTPQAGMSTFLFSSSNAQQASAIVRLLDFGEADDGVNLSRVSMEPSAAINSSSLSITFTHFDGSLLFDPDIGLLLGSSGGGSGGNDNLGLIVGVAVAIPLAVVFVVGAITVTLAVIVIKRRIALANSRGAVSFDPQPHDDDQQL